MTISLKRLGLVGVGAAMAASIVIVAGQKRSGSDEDRELRPGGEDVHTAQRSRASVSGRTLPISDDGWPKASGGSRELAEHESVSNWPESGGGDILGGEDQPVRLKGAVLINLQRAEEQYVEMPTALHAQLLAEACVIATMDQTGTADLGTDPITSATWKSDADVVISAAGKRYWVSFHQFPAYAAIMRATDPKVAHKRASGPASKDGAQPSAIRIVDVDSEVGVELLRFVNETKSLLAK